MNKDYLVSEYWRFVREKGYHPRRDELTKKIGFPGRPAYEKEFGTWSSFIDFIGYKKYPETSKEDLKQYLLDFYNKYNKIPTSEDIRLADDAPPLNRFKENFGSFTNAIIECNLNKTEQDIKNELIEEFKLYLNKYPDEDLTYLNFAKHKEFKHPATYIQYFGSWNNFLKLMNLDVKYREYTDELLIFYLKDFYEKYGRSPKKEEIDRIKNYPHSSVYNNHFGSFNNALTLASLPLNHKMDYKKEDIIEFFNDFYNKYNRPPTYYECRSPYPSTPIIEKFFGSFNKALIELGFEVRVTFYKDDDKENLLKMVKDKCNELGRTIKARELRENNLPDVIVFYRLFGSWNKVLELIDQPLNFQPNYTKEYLLEQLHLVSQEYSCIPKQELLKSPYPSRLAYVSAFGTWSNALREAGFVPQEDFYEKENLINLLNNYAKKLGRTPSSWDLSQNEEIPSQTTYQRHFGTYRNACIEAGLEPNKIGFSKVYYSKNKDMCFSQYEKIITDYLINNNIKYEKDISYKNILENDFSRRTLDWIIELNNKYYYIEYFGLWSQEFYEVKAKKKIKDLYKAGLINNCLFIFPYDMQHKSLDEIFQSILKLQQVA